VRLLLFECAPIEVSCLLGLRLCCILCLLRLGIWQQGFTVLVLCLVELLLLGQFCLNQWGGFCDNCLVQWFRVSNRAEVV